MVACELKPKMHGQVVGCAARPALVAVSFEDGGADAFPVRGLVALGLVLRRAARVVGAVVLVVGAAAAGGELAAAGGGADGEDSTRLSSAHVCSRRVIRLWRAVRLSLSDRLG